ncbi:hypothetical protein RUM44_013663 [Polyplax serrata]|uniref:Uncharacterized protein n=1 Tax=Polyplax serrata TaxID=468196 RepID=A0ABR1BES9_POLSC
MAVYVVDSISRNMLEMTNDLRRAQKSKLLFLFLTDGNLSTVHIGNSLKLDSRSRAKTTNTSDVELKITETNSHLSVRHLTSVRLPCEYAVPPIAGKRRKSPVTRLAPLTLHRHRRRLKKKKVLDEFLTHEGLQKKSSVENVAEILIIKTEVSRPCLMDPIKLHPQ